jgi:hypothetical protein
MDWTCLIISATWKSPMDFLNFETQKKEKMLIAIIDRAPTTQHDWDPFLKGVVVTRVLFFQFCDVAKVAIVHKLI